MGKSGEDQAEANDAKVDDREKRWQWFFRTRVGPDGKTLDGFGKRTVLTSRDAALQAAPPAAPGPHGALNWAPLGPSVVGFGQAAGRPPVSGRITALAVGPDALRVYAGAANGGVWFSADSGTSWAPLHDFIVSTSPVPGVASNALSVGDFAVRFGQGAAVDDVFVGTGEPGAADGYFGIGIRHSANGGAPGTWSIEATNLALSNIYRITIDPDDPKRVFASTGKGLFIRPVGGDPSQWNQVVSPAFPHANGPATDFLVAGRGPSRLYYVVFADDGVFSSPDGQEWTAVPGVVLSKRIVLAASQSDPRVVYALTSAGGLFRLVDGVFQAVNGIPRALFAGGQGSYDLILGVDPSNPDRVYLGGDITLDSPDPGDPSDYNLSLFAGTLTSEGQGGFVFPFDLANDFDPSRAPGSETINVPKDPTWIGRGIHPDAHAMTFALIHDGSAFDGKSVWIGCDGGVFQSSNGGMLGSFEARNLGLADIELTFFAQHPVSDAILFCGCQDNGTVRRIGGPVWSETVEGDGGGVALDPNRPHQVMRQYHNSALYTSTDGGTSDKWQLLNFPPRTAFAPPGTTPTGEPQLQSEAATEEDAATGFYARIAAFGRDAQTTLAAFGTSRVWLTEDWGTTWVTLPSGINPYDPNQRPPGTAITTIDSLDGSPVTAIAFATADRIFAATTGSYDASQPPVWRPSTIWRFDRGTTEWTRTPITNAGLPAIAYITALAIDDVAAGSLYVTLGFGGIDHVWHFDGTTWRSAGLTAARLDVPANAVVVDPANRKIVFVGTDLGVWKGTRTGPATWTWALFSSGLPEAAVSELAVHAGERLLRAATHGRGLWEIPLDATSCPDPDLFLRANPADSGRLRNGVRPAWLDTIEDPSGNGLILTHGMSPDIKVRRGSLSGLPAIVDQPDSFDFAYRIGEQNQGGFMLADASGLNTLYVQVHNRGISAVPGTLVRVLVLLADVTGGAPPPLPNNLATHLAAGDVQGWLTGTAWLFADPMVPYRFLHGTLDNRTPQVVGYTVDFGSLGLPAGHDRVCAVAFITSVNSSDPFTATGTDLDQLVMHDKHVAYQVITLLAP